MADEAYVTKQVLESALLNDTTEALVTKQYIEVALLKDTGNKPIICSIVT